MKYFPVILAIAFVVHGITIIWGSQDILNEILARNKRITNNFLKKLSPHQKRSYHSLHRRFRSHRSWDLHQKEIRRFKSSIGYDLRTRDELMKAYREQLSNISANRFYCDPPNPCPPKHILPGAENCLKDYPKHDMKNFSEKWVHSLKDSTCNCDAEHNSFCSNDTAE